MRSYAIGDIHGQLSLLEDAHSRITADRAAYGDDTAPVVHLGDLVDRGPDSAGVIRFLREGLARGENWVVLKGNHDRLFERFLSEPDWRDERMSPEVSYLHPAIGGQETLMSYGLFRPSAFHIKHVREAAVMAVPTEDITFLRERPLMHRVGEQLFVHAGIRPGTPLPEQIEQDLLWIREPFLSDTREHGFLVVHGHTAIPQATHYRNRVNIDSRAAYGGPLTAIVIENRSVWRLTDTGRVPLLPL
ncbi:MAG: serine/threonine protein phosphatase [Rhodobacteraceae bacterium]|nr:MAG: serine/threonine protein phosphatase [Paracoccaceae bacterium]